MFRSDTNTNKKILITGSNGFIGRYLKSNLKCDFDIFTTARKDSDYDVNLTHNFPANSNFDVIIHCAADPKTNFRPESKRALLDNILMTYNMLDFAAKQEKCHFINISTVLVYNQDNGSIKPKTIYGTSKLASELLCFNFQQINPKLSYTNLRIPATTGPNLTHGVIKDIVRKIKESDGEIELIGKEPGSRKPFLHVSELTNKINYIIQNKIYGDIFLGPDDNISVLEIANIAMELLDKKVKINWTNQTWAGDDRIISTKPSMMTKLNSYETIKLTIKDMLNE